MKQRRHCAFSGELLNPVQQTFNCVITSDLTCPKCGATTTKPEIQRVINLRFQETSQNTQFSLEYLLSNAFQPPQTDFECDSCHQKVPSTKPYFSIAPRVLVLSINRFKFESSVSKKLRHSVTFPGVLDLSPFTQPSTLVPAPLKHLHPLPPIFSDSAWKRGLNEDDIIEHKMEDAVISFLEDHFSSRRITLQNLPLPEIPREQEYLLSLGEFLAVGEHLGFHNGPTHGQPQSHSRDVMDEETIDCEALHQINVEEEEQKQAESLDRLFAVLETCPHPNDPHSPTTIRATLPFAIDITSSLFFQFAHEKNLKRRMNRTLDTEFVEILKTKHPFNIDLVSIPPLDRRSEIYKQYGFPMKKPKPPIQRKLNEPPPRRSTTLPSGHPYPTLKPTLLSQVPRLSHLTPSPFHPLERRISNNQMNFSLNKSSGHPLGGVASFIRHAQPIPSSSRHSDNWDTRFLSVNIPQPNISISRGYNMGGHPEPEIIGEIAQKQKRDHPTPSNPVEFKSPPILQTLGVFGDHVEIIENTDSEAEAISFQISETLVDEFGNEEILDRLIDSSERGGLLGGGKDSDFIDDGTSGDDTINATDSEGGMDASTVPMLDHQYQPLEHPRHSHRPYQTTIEVFPQDDSMSADGLWNYPLTRSQSSIEPNHPPHLTPLPNSQPAKEKGAEDAGSFERVRVGADERVFGVPGSNFVYELSGIILHSGKSVTRGHYETYVKNINTQEWMHINDSQTKVVDLDTILAQENVKQDCYLLFYTHTGSVKDQ
ncbi:putative Ubiquitin carboxyl-terminal hydrolase [Blattamonas nauphoetae]|uniref:ubiquitinyl hydrolase 1 n=1 Tax=Blattamonas nauphoetae TaxID=2049346 RepID=A0ABQ9YC50_9EUKA|nr:putative Ubiquitin carboxyl-terminal hydrolase [Blattamonas nauphoetae]